MVGVLRVPEEVRPQESLGLDGVGYTGSLVVSFEWKRNSETSRLVGTDEGPGTGDRCRGEDGDVGYDWFEVAELGRPRS